MWNSFALAVHALTGLDTLPDARPTREEARRAVILFPLVGFLVGIGTAVAWTVGSRVWAGQPLVSAALALAAGAWLTGGRGLGGVARPRDGLAAHGSGGDRARAFAVMRDARRGTTGLVALGVCLLLRFAFLAALPPGPAWPLLALAGALGGWARAFAVSAFPSAEGGGGLSEAGPNEFLGATLVVIVCGAVLPARGLWVLLAVALVAAPVGQTVRRRLGGLNLPLCAALGEAAEIVALACFSIRL